MLNSARDGTTRLLGQLAIEKYRGVRICTGVFAAYFFGCYFYLADWFWIFRSKTEQNFLNSILSALGHDSSVLLMRVVLACLLLISLLFATGRWVRISALIIWFGYTLFYNFFICINQPFITYFIHILLTYAFLSNEPFWKAKETPGANFRGGAFLFILAAVYMSQMTISGFSKALSPEWRTGETLSLMLNVHDPEPGLRFLGILPVEILKLATWLTLALECASILYLFVPRLRLPIWLGHVFMYMFIVAFVPHAMHVAAAMLIFQWLILVPPKALREHF